MKFVVADLFRPGVDIPTAGSWLYAISTDAVVLYVGQAVNPYRRLRQHFEPADCIAWHGSQLTELARDNWDDAQQWRIELTATAGDLNRAEAALIRKLRPCLNRAHNDVGTKVPDHLLVLARAREKELLARFHELRRAEL